jgi:zinc D-Ala-D-Ala carboxypeptidase
MVFASPALAHDAWRPAPAAGNIPMVIRAASAVELSRRRVLMLALAASLGGGVLASQAARADEPDLAAVRNLVRAGVERDSFGDLARVFALEPPLAAEVLLRATRLDALPDSYAPLDLVNATSAGIPSAGQQFVRATIADDTRALIAEAAAAGQTLYVGSGFRSQAYQVDVFAAQAARWGDAEIANRYSARPGHSQHQLGTTVDFTTSFGAFRSSQAASWLRDNAHRFGFILPYTAASTSLTGYVDEPWHGRWVGTMLASGLQALGYQDWTTLDADDVVALVRAEAGLDA